MKNLNLAVFSAAYTSVVNAWGSLIESKNENDILYITLENNCTAKDQVKVAFDQHTMSIYTVGSCNQNCSCVRAHDRIIPLVEQAIAG